MNERQRWLRYGSTYDPNFSGKIPLDRNRREPELQSQSRICFCGDPDCTYHLDGKSSVSRSREYEVLRYFEESLPDSAIRAVLFDPSGPSGRAAVDPSPPKPSAGYTKARKDVEKWLMKAPDQAFDDVVGNEDALAALRDAIEAPVRHAELYQAYGLKMPKGALLSGPPGCGKTMFARAAASEMSRLYGAEVEFISISGAELQSPYVGMTEGYIKAIFTFAREYKAFHGHPLLVFMDEAEVLLPDRTGRVRRVAPWEESQVATFLAEMDGIAESGAFVLLASNRPEVIDQAVLRDGRCDFKVEVKRPTREACEAILRRAFAGTPAENGDVEPLIFAAIEALYDPHKILLEARELRVQLAMKNGQPEVSDLSSRTTGHFLLEHIVSGALATSVPARARRFAFARDKADGKVTGVTVGDVLTAVNQLYEENRRLDHSFARQEWERTREGEALSAAAPDSNPEAPHEPA